MSTNINTDEDITQVDEDNLPPPPGLQNQDDEDGDDPWAIFGDDAKDLVSKKGWKDPKQVLQSYTEAEKEMTRARQEAAQLRQLLQIVQEQFDSEDSKPQQLQQPQQPDYEALAEQCLLPDGTYDVSKIMSISIALGAQMSYNAAEAKMREYISQFENEKFAPLAEQNERARVAEEIAEQEEIYGANFDAINEIAQELHDNDDSLFERLGVEGLYARAAAVWLRDQQQRAEEESDAYTLSRGSRRPKAKRQTVEERELEWQEQIARRPNDGL